MTFPRVALKRTYLPVRTPHAKANPGSNNLRSRQQRALRFAIAFVLHKLADGRVLRGPLKLRALDIQVG